MSSPGWSCWRICGTRVRCRASSLCGRLRGTARLALLRGVIQYANDGRRSSASPLFLSGLWSSTFGRRHPNFGVPSCRVRPGAILALVRIAAPRGAFGGVASALVPTGWYVMGRSSAACSRKFGPGMALNAPFVMGATLISSMVGLVCAGLHRHHRPRAIDEILPAYDVQPGAALRYALILGATEALMNRTGSSCWGGSRTTRAREYIA
jgi:hypothetical protein